MGALSSKKTPGQVLIVGPPEAGKTTLLYRLKFENQQWDADKTTGFQFEELRGGDGPNEHEVGVWDIGGG